MRSQRSQVPEAVAKRASEQVALHLARLPEWQSAETVASYFATRGEFDPGVVAGESHAQGKTVVYPRVLGPGAMAFYKWQPGDPLQPNSFGIPEPLAEAEPVPAQDINFFMVPLLACDRSGARLGYGGGFYDRLLNQSEGFRCGVGYNQQYVAQLPRESHDQRLEAFISESGLIRFNRVG